MKSDRVMIFESMRIATKYLDPDTRLKIYDTTDKVIEVAKQKERHRAARSASITIR